jgi:hypothetical protein
MNKPLVRFGILSFDWRGFAVGIFDRMPDNTIKLIDFKLSNSTSVDDFAAIIAPYKADCINPLKAVYMNRSIAFEPIHHLLGKWIALCQVREITNVPDLLVTLKMLLDDGKILMSENDARHFQSDIKKATVTDYSISVNMLLMLVARWRDIQNIGVSQEPIRWR